MILYNVTVNVSHEVHTEWLKWMIEKHVPDVFATGCFANYKILKLLTEDEDATGVTYAIQYFLNAMADLEEYQEKHAARLRKEHTDRYKNKFVAFRTVLEVLDEKK